MFWAVARGRLKIQRNQNPYSGQMLEGATLTWHWVLIPEKDKILKPSPGQPHATEYQQDLEGRNLANLNTIDLFQGTYLVRKNLIARKL